MQPQTEIKPQEQNVQQQNQQTAPAKQPETEAPQIKSDENKNNWAAFRAQREADRKAREESDKIAKQKAAEAEALKAALEAITSKPGPAVMDEQEEETEQKRIDKAIDLALKRERERIRKEQEERERVELPSKLVSTYKDFDHVCTTENLDYLEYHYPEVAAPYKHIPDSFDKWAGIYAAVKRFVPNTNPNNEKAKIEKNLQKPGSASTPGASVSAPLPAARLSEDRKAANWERMQKALKGLS